MKRLMSLAVAAALLLCSCSGGGQAGQAGQAAGGAPEPNSASPASAASNDVQGADGDAAEGGDSADSAIHSVKSDSKLNIYIWSDYVDPKTVEEFSKANNIEIRYDNYDSNETLEAKVLTGKSGYDLAGPGGANLARQIKAGAYQKIDKSKLKNYGNISPYMLKLLDAIDPGNEYAVPYFLGTNTVGVNREAVEKALGGPLPENIWDLVFNPQYTSKLKSCGISYLDSPSEVFPVALHYLGLPPDSSKPEDLQQAFEMMKKVRPDIKRFSSSGYINDLARGDLCVAIGYNGDIGIGAQRAVEAKAPFTIEALAAKDGLAVWVDNWAIPAGAENVDNALKYIDWTLDPKIAARNAEAVTYYPGSAAAVPLLPKELAQNRAYIPSEDDLAKSFIIKPFDPAGVRRTVRLWQTLKSQK